MSALSPDLASFDLIQPDRYVQRGYPHEEWARLRREAPVLRFESNREMPFWAITKHADIAWIGKQPERFLNGPTLVIRTEPDTRSGAFRPPPTLIEMDPPRHGAMPPAREQALHARRAAQVPPRHRADREGDRRRPARRGR